MRLFRLATGLVAALLFASTGTALHAQTADVLHVGCGGTEFDAEAYYAQELGLFKKYGLTVEIQRLRGGPDVQAAVAGGSFQIGDTTFSRSPQRSSTVNRSPSSRPARSTQPPRRHRCWW